MGKAILRKCREPRAEGEHCKRKGHTTAICPRKKNINTVKATNTARNSYERMMSVNDYQLKGLIDTGSSRTLMRKLSKNISV